MSIFWNLIKTRPKLSEWTILIITFIAFYVIFNTNNWNYKDRVISWDIICYYDYLPATFIYHDITLSFIGNDTIDFQNRLFWFGITPEGGRYIKTSMGMAAIYFPFFIGAHLSAHLLDYNTWGFSKPYKMALVFSTVFYLWLGLFFLRKTLVRYYSELVTSLTLIFIAFGTNYFRYATIDAPMPHIYCFALFGIFIYLTIKWYDDSSIKYTILLGLVGGMISLVRPTNAIIALFFIFYKITSFSDIKMRMQYFLKHYNYIFLIIFIAFLLWVPQFLYWKKVTGHFLFFSYGEERFFFDHPRIFKGLFSYRNGWLLYAPVMIFSLLGIPLLLHQIKSIFLPVLIFTVVNIYIVLSWWCWWYTGFGNRAMIDSYAILSFPMAAFIKWSFQRKPWQRIFLISIITLAFLQGVFHSIQFQYNGIHYNSMTKDAYWESFWKLGSTNEYWKKLKEPDYQLAMKGIDGYLTDRNAHLNYYFDLEDNHQFMGKIMDTSGVQKIFTSDSIFKEFAHSGNNCVFVNAMNPYGMGLQFRVFNNEKYQVSVWRKKTEINSYLVVNNIQNANYYSGENKAIMSEGDWEKIQMEIEITPAIHNTIIRIYVMNENPEKVYFDDLRVERIH